ncbi:MAG: ribosome silencing factor [Rhodobacterales bacterium]|nr:MAG: ribosome silencing factor [Rhodobacterales bacterium]
MLVWGHPGAGAVRRSSLEDHVLSLGTFAETPAETGAVMSAASQHGTSAQMLDAVLTSLSDDKAEDVVQIDLRGKSEMGDHMVIASGRSSRQVSAMAEHLVDMLKQQFSVASKVEGKETGDWVLIDGGDVIVHLFRPEVREFYQLEKMWLPEAAAAR